VKEALHNIIKHAQATEAELNFIMNNDVLTVIISDNGIGMPHGDLNVLGHGLNNLRSRMKSINGEFSIGNHNGTKITLTMPV
jgi:signal transduction histidine kinase